LFSISCALVLGSQDKNFAADKSWRFHHQNHLQGAVFNNAYGIPAGSLGSDLLCKRKHYPNSTLILLKYQRKILRIEGQSPDFTVTTNKTRINLK
jgi:hypothetical protein